MGIDKWIIGPSCCLLFPMAVGTRTCCRKGKQIMLWHLYLNWFSLSHYRSSRATYKASIKSHPTLIAFQPAQEAACSDTLVALAELSLLSVGHSWPDRLFQKLGSKESAGSFSFEHGSSSAVCKTHIPVIWSHMSDFINAYLPPTEDPD